MNQTRKPVKISLLTAQRLAVHKQGLACRPDAGGRHVLLDIIRRIGLLQLDTIHVVARSHYLVMLSRAGLYDPRDLDALLYPDRQLFEQWAHAACLIPVEDYPYFAPVILARRLQPHGGLGSLGESPHQVLSEVLDRVRAEGPVRSVDFEDPRAQRGTWWDWKPAKIALEILFEEGYLMIDQRVNFHRYYDLAERVLPASAVPPAHSVEDWRRWAALRGLACLGVATLAQIADYYRQPRTLLKPVLETLQDQGAILPAEVEGWKDVAFVASGDLELVGEIEAGTHRPALTAFLSPFDNLVWHRRRIHDLFNFDYRIEVYTPRATKARRYGYYVLPILRNGRLIGRMDPKADRRSKMLILHAIYLEPGQVIDEALLAELSAALREFAAFHGCNVVRIARSEPADLAELLLRRL